MQIRGRQHPVAQFRCEVSGSFLAAAPPEQPNVVGYRVGLRGVFWCKVGTRARGWARAQGLEVGPSYSLRVRLDRLEYCSVERTPEYSNIICVFG